VNEFEMTVALALQSVDRLDEAESILRAVASNRVSLGQETDPTLRRCRFYLGNLLLAAGRHAEADEVLSSLISTEESRAAWTSFEIHQITRDRALARSRMGMTEGVQQDLESSFLALRWAVGPRHREVRTAHEALLEHLDTTDRPEALRSWLDISGEPDTR
ncbi:MAG TPA: hypothetical protein QF730_10070, partial [Planctomycetota bacterium]|nr:hypothetical protein [Planctomycetota bacterium]